MPELRARLARAERMAGGGDVVGLYAIWPERPGGVVRYRLSDGRLLTPEECRQAGVRVGRIKGYEGCSPDDWDAPGECDQCSS